MTIALYILLAITTTLWIITLSKLNKKKIMLNKLVDNVKSEVRKGYIKTNSWYYKGPEADPNNNNYKVKMYVTELEEYTNGESKLRLDKIEIIRTPPNCPQSARNFLIRRIKNEFSTVQKTSKVTWLVTKDSIKEQRRKKLEEIMK